MAVLRDDWTMPASLLRAGCSTAALAVECTHRLSTATAASGGPASQVVVSPLMQVSSLGAAGGSDTFHAEAHVCATYWLHGVQNLVLRAGCMGVLHAC